MLIQESAIPLQNRSKSSKTSSTPARKQLKIVFSKCYKHKRFKTFWREWQMNFLLFDPLSEFPTGGIQINLKEASLTAWIQRFFTSKKTSFFKLRFLRAQKQLRAQILAGTHSLANFFKADVEFWKYDVDFIYFGLFSDSENSLSFFLFFFFFLFSKSIFFCFWAWGRNILIFWSPSISYHDSRSLLSITFNSENSWKILDNYKS